MKNAIVGPVVCGVLTTLAAAPRAEACSPVQVLSPVQRALLPLPPSVPVNAALFALPVGEPTTVLVRANGVDGDTLTSDTGDIRLPRLEPETDYEFVITTAEETLSLSTRTTSEADDQPPGAPDISADVNRSGGHFDLANTCDSSPGPIVWRDASESAFVTLIVEGDAIAAVRLDDSGAIAELSAFGGFGFRDIDAAAAASFAVIDAAGNVSDVVIADVDVEGGGCAQTSTSTTAALSLLGLLLFARRRRA